MQQFMDMPIKGLIDRVPQVGVVLMAYGIDCATCSVGVCPLKDIVSIHYLSKEDEVKVMAAVGAVLDPTFPQPALPATPSKKARAARPSIPIRELVEEHDNIKCWISAVLSLKAEDVMSLEGLLLLEEGVVFVRQYADKFHHAKEEDVLFDYTDKSSAIVKAMYMDHEAGRLLVGLAAAALARKDAAEALGFLQEHATMLIEHIRKEDEILYPWIDRQLTKEQVTELIVRFQGVDEVSDIQSLQGMMQFSRNIKQRAAVLQK